MNRSIVVLAAFLMCASSGCAKRAPDTFPGYAEADYVRLASPMSGTLTKLHLQRGDSAAAAAPAFVLEQESENAARQEALSRVERAKAQLADLKKGRRPDELASVRAQIAEAESTLAFSKSDFARMQQLAGDNFISPARLDETRSKLNRDQGRVNDLHAQLRTAQLGARPDEIDAAQKEIDAAMAQVAQAGWRVNQKTQRTPVAGTVIDTLYREGEWVPAGGAVVTLLPPSNIKARFFVGESRLGQLKLGQAVSLSCDGCGTPIGGTISFISPEAEYTSPIIYSKENRASLVFMIEAKPDAAQAARLHPGQPLEVRLASGVRS
ncbi:MAG: HlyD family efflux transporter periplasmic adaptor subunit [Betaproteobacteria bacterium]